MDVVSSSELFISMMWVYDWRVKEEERVVEIQ